MTIRRSSSGPQDLGTILACFAHPDDETYLAAGVMAAARDHGQRVVCVSATEGERGTDDPLTWPPDRLGPVRRWEAAAAMAVLGVDEHIVLGHPDGGLRCDDAIGVGRIGELIDEIAPDTILTFGPDGMTYHGDHIAVHHWVTTAWRRRGRSARLFYATSTVEFLAEHRELFDHLGVYMTDERPAGVPPEGLDLYLQLEGLALDRKVTALRAMATQTNALVTTLGPDRYARFVNEECFVEARR
jgi:LmbE family N-acetylglucosaminyl deacetylase